MRAIGEEALACARACLSATKARMASGSTAWTHSVIMNGPR